MRLSGWDVALTLLLAIGEAIMVKLLWKRARRWPFLLSLNASDCVTGPALLLLAPDYHVYFYVYWSASCLRAILLFGVIADVIRSIPGVKHTPRHILLMFFGLTTAVTFGVVFLTSRHLSGSFEMVGVVLFINSCATTALMTFCLAALGSLSFVGFAWPQRSLYVMSGFLVATLGSSCEAWAISHSPRHASVFGFTNSLLYLFILFSWACAFRTSPIVEQSSQGKSLCA